MEKKDLHAKLFGTLPRASIELFKKYHNERPEIYEQFRAFALQMRKTGRERYSAKCIMERIRWEHDMQYADDEFKISNSMTSMYVRMLIWNYPEFIGFFKLKRVRGVRVVGKPSGEDEVRL